MPATKRSKPLYKRGTFALHRREGRENLEIVWYDAERRRERSASARTSDLREGKLELDRHYLANEGQGHCPTCRRPWDGEQSPFLTSVISDYLILSKGKAGFASARGRLRHVVEYLAVSSPSIRCDDVNERWVAGLRKHLLAQPVLDRKGEFLRDRALGAVEGCILQLAAAINSTDGQTAQFKPVQPKQVAASPTYRADIAMLARMFDYCLHPDEPTERMREIRVKERANLLRYLRAAVSTWARPDAIFDIHASQWSSAARVLDLNPRGRPQTKKHRPRVPIPKQFAPFLDALTGNYFSIVVLNVPWAKMQKKLWLPKDRESGLKLIRRSMATIARKRIGEANWRQGEMMLGHVKTSISDVYALPDPANLGIALKATESIIDEIESLAPGAFDQTFYRTVTAPENGEGTENG